MARWQGLAGFIINSRKYPAGTTYADTVGNAVGKDVVYAPFGTSAGISPMLQPLDGAATALRGASRFSSHSIPCTITGVNSIDG